MIFKKKIGAPTTFRYSCWNSGIFTLKPSEKAADDTIDNDDKNEHQTESIVIFYSKE